MPRYLLFFSLEGDNIFGFQAYRLRRFEGNALYRFVVCVSLRPKHFLL